MALARDLATRTHLGLQVPDFRPQRRRARRKL